MSAHFWKDLVSEWTPFMPRPCPALCGDRLALLGLPAPDAGGRRSSWGGPELPKLAEWGRSHTGEP